MKTYKLKSAFELTKTQCHLAGENDFIEVTEWENGEGVTITQDKQTANYTHGEIDLINLLILTLKSSEVKLWN